MLKYKIMVDFFAVLAIASTVLGCYYTTISDPALWITILVYFLAACEVIGDIMIIWYISTYKDDDGGDGIWR